VKIWRNGWVKTCDEQWDVVALVPKCYIVDTRTRQKRKNTVVG
jgi:hypothetical protein